MIRQSIIYLLVGITALTAETFNVSNVPDLRNAFLNASTNHQHDTIILAKGTYKTTEDGFGPFDFLDNEAYDLTIQAESGLTAEDVILDGDKTDTVLISNGGRTFFLKNLTITQGKEHGVFSWQDVEIDRCEIHHNGDKINEEDYHGGGIAVKVLKLTNSDVSYNMSGRRGGGIDIIGFDGFDYSFIDNSYIHHNESDGWGGGINTVGHLTITNSRISSNIAHGRGGGIRINSGLTHINISYSRIDHNKAILSGACCSEKVGGAAIYGGVKIDKSRIDHNEVVKSSPESVAGIVGDSKITNTIIDHNIHGLAVSLGYNSIFINNTVADNTMPGGSANNFSQHVVYLMGEILNNIFYNNYAGVFIGNKSSFYNNYYDKNNMDDDGGEIYFKHNKQPGDGPVNFGSEYQLKADNPVVINTGLNPDSAEFEEVYDRFNLPNHHYPLILPYLKADYTNDVRVAGGTIDMGAYEYSAPHADAGSDKRAQVNKPILIEGKGTGSIVSYKWEKDGNLLSDKASFEYTPDTIGIDTLTLTVTNCEGVTNTDTIKVTVSEFPPFDVPPILYLLF